MSLRVTRYQLMIWMVASGRLILPDGLSRCDRDWFDIPVTRDVQRVAPPEVSDGDASLAACNALRPQWPPTVTCYACNALHLQRAPTVMRHTTPSPSNRCLRPVSKRSRPAKAGGRGGGSRRGELAPP